MKVYQAHAERDADAIRELFREYLQWGYDRLLEAYGIKFPIAEALEDDMRTLDKFMPPEGRLLLAESENKLAGLACMKKLTADICELKRMYVRQDFRRQGIGRILVQSLIADAKIMNIPIMRLDSAGFMKEAHALYRSLGFEEIQAYEGSEIPKELQQHWIFMELKL